MKFTYSITLSGGAVISGARELVPGENRIVETLPVGKIQSVRATLPLVVAEDEAIFMNGYQTWTACPERRRRDRIFAGIRRPKLLADHFGVDRYGDYHFVDYPNRPGVTHGESWCYFRRGERYRLFASLSEENGYTLFRYDAAASLLTAERDCVGLRCGGEFAVFEIYVAEGTEDEVFDGWFDAMKLRPRTDRRLTGYSSWYNRYQDISEQSIRDDLNGCATLMERGELFQIDDGWEPAVGDWLTADAKKFPHGMRDAADAIHAKGYLAGLWLAPFVCQKESRIYREHPDWLLKHEGGDWYCGSNWGGFFALDIDNAEFVDYLRRCFDRVLNDWGFDLLKLDFLYAAAPFGSEDESRAARMSRAVRLLRELCGDKLILGCGVPLMPAFGLVDYCRIGCDVGLDWKNNLIVRNANREVVSTRNSIGNTVFRRQLNGRAWLNDPDVFFLRDDNLKLSEGQKRTLAEVNALFGGILLCSDSMGEYDDNKRAYYNYLLRLRNAQDVRVESDGKRLCVCYTLDGTTHRIEV